MRGGNGKGSRVSGDAGVGAGVFYVGRGEDSMTCDEVKILLSDYWSQTLSETQELSFEAHTAACDNCRAETERLGALWKSLSLIPGSSADFEPSASLRGRFYETLGAYRQGLESAPRRSLREK